MKTRLLAATLAATCLATPAFAEDLSGFRIEGRVGWESGRLAADYPDPDDADEILTFSDSESNISYGIEAGYDAMIGESFVLGAYGGVDFSDVERCEEIFGDDLGCLGTGRNFTAGLRAGVAVTPAFLLYAKGGYSNGRLEFAYDSDVEDDDELDADVPEVSESQDGYHLGAGAEVAFGPNVYGKLEYVFTDYGNVRFLGVEADDEPTATIRARRHQLLAGIGLRF